jgi:hypothetical protein
MIALVSFIWSVLTARFKPKRRLDLENAALRHQVVVLQRKVRSRIEFSNHDRLFFILLYRWCPSILKAMMIVRPETVVRWHRAGFRRYWRWKSQRRGGRPPVSAELRALIRRMSVENVLWGAPRIQGELLKLGFVVAQSTVSKYMAKRDNPSGQRWGTFLRNHAKDREGAWSDRAGRVPHARRQPGGRRSGLGIRLTVVLRRRLSGPNETARQFHAIILAAAVAEVPRCLIPRKSWPTTTKQAIWPGPSWRR